MTGITRSDVHLIIAIFLGSLIGVQAWDISRNTDNPIFAFWEAGPQGQESLSGIAQALFNTWVVPFEALSILLLIALVGAVAVAMRAEPGGDA